MTEKELESFADAIGAAIAEATAPLRKQIEALEASIRQIEQRGAFEYVGTFQRALRYRRGSVCTHRGGMWIALVDIDPASSGPGEDDCWQLAVKPGRDGKDAGGSVIA